MSKYRIRINGKSYEMEVERIDEDQAPEAQKESFQKSWVSAGNPKPFVQVINSSAERKVENDDHSVSSPMPGTVVKVYCAKGDTVKKGQTVVLLEAMKMENEIAASKDGYIKEIYVSEGMSIAGGMVLFDIAE